MRGRVVVMCLAMLIMFAGCGKPSKAALMPEDETSSPITRPEDGYTSEVSKEDCYICRYTDDDAPWKPEGWMQDNIGIISLNTFDVKVISINRYDYDGEAIEEPFGFMSVSTVSSETEGGFTATVWEHPDRGYADLDIKPENDLTLDIEKPAALLCKECLNETVSMSIERTHGIGLIDLTTGEIHPFEQNVVGFEFGNFLIRCEAIEPTSDRGSFMIDTFAVYRPLRYVEE